MSVITFTYVSEPIRNLNTQQLVGHVFRPKIPIRLSFNHKVLPIQVECLVDSGADKCLFPAAWGESAGINIKKGKVNKIYGIGSSQVEAYSHRVKLYLGTVSITSEADFSYQHQIPLLGRIGFFNCFQKVIFKDQERLLELEL